MFRNVLLYLTLVFGAAPSAQSVNISGTVTNKSGQAISGAEVELLGQNLKDTTDSQGTYTLLLNVSVNHAFILHRTEHIYQKNGILSISLAKPAPVRIELFDVKGKLLDRLLDDPAAAGDYHYDVMNRLQRATMMLVRVSIGRRTSTFRYLSLRNSSGKVPFYIPPSPGGRLARRHAIVDTLKVTAAHYQSIDTAIFSYSGVMDINLDTLVLDKFSYFVTSLKALQDLSGREICFGGDLRFGKTGPGAGLLGADSICACIAERSMPGSKVKQWRAFLSAAKGPNGNQVNAIDRIGQGPWYDRLGRLVSNNISELKNFRPAGADPVIINDLPNEDGIPNQRPDPNLPAVDNHHIITGSDYDGTLYSPTATCADWTSTTYSEGKPRFGFSWPRRGPQIGEIGTHWISGWDAPGCAAGIHIYNDGSGPIGEGNIIGGGGGYGGFYCFALNP